VRLLMVTFLLLLQQRHRVPHVCDRVVAVASALAAGGKE
jgi:hypothetical protein